jgi:hypothetical protein
VAEGEIIMRMSIVAVSMVLGLGACSTGPHPLVPDTPEGPASYVCYSSTFSNPAEVRGIADRQCGRSGMGVSALIGQEWTPLRCGLITPTVAAFRCGRGGSSYYY